MTIKGLKVVGDRGLAPKLDPVVTVLVAGDLRDGSATEDVLREDVVQRFEEILLRINRFVKETTFPEAIYRAGKAPEMRILADVGRQVEAPVAKISSHHQVPLHVIASDSNTQEILGQAERVVAMGPRGDDAEASPRRSGFDAALAFGDVVLVVGDGRSESGSEGSAGSLIRKAALARKPVIWIDKLANVKLLGHGDLEDEELVRLCDFDIDLVRLASEFRDVRNNPEYLDRCLAQLVDPAGVSRGRGKVASGSAEERLLGYFEETSGGLWERFLQFARGLKKVLFSKGEKSASASTDDTAPADFFSRLRRGLGNAFSEGSVEPWIGPVEPEDGPIRSPSELMERFVWSDDRAGAAASAHRQMIWFVYLSGAFAVFAAVAGAVYLWPFGGGYGWPTIELLVVASIMLTVLVAKRRRWHYSWLSHRFMAEQLRYLRMGLPLMATPGPWHQPLWRKSEGEACLRSAELWILQRALTVHGVPQARLSDSYDAVTPENNRVLADYVENVIEDQLDYHKKNYRRKHRTHERLHKGSMALFGLTVGSIIGHFLLHVKAWLIGTAFLPALAAAIHGIVTKLEVARIAKQSHQTAERLELYRRVFRSLQEDMGQEGNPASTWKNWNRLRDLTGQASETLSSENAQWEQLIREQETELPS
jgi:hypothetical protein